jgi:predicted TIM-barrel fold metal-dependent hydrolase
LAWPFNRTFVLTMSTPNQPPSPALYRRIATEEAFAPPELLALYRKVLATPPVDPGFQHLMGFYMSSPSERAQHIMRCLQDLDQVRLQHMDESGIDVQVIGMTSPGVQILDRDTAVGFMPQANDILAAAVRRHPTRFVGMLSVAPQDPQASAKEIERGVNQLGMHSVIINSHTHGEYLSDTKFWPIFEAAEAMGTPIYLHPNAMPASMIQHFIEAGLDGAIYGFGVETGLHALRLMTSGVFDRFPKLQIVLGPHGRGAAVLVVPLGLHAPRDGQLQALPIDGPGQAQAQRIPARKLSHHQQRCGVGSGDQVHPRPGGRGPRALRHGLPLSVRRGRSAHPRCDEHVRRCEDEVLPNQCRAFVQHSARQVMWAIVI